MTEQSEHLSNAQIENYGNRSSGAGPEPARREEHQRVADQPVGQRNDDHRNADEFLQHQRLDDERIEAHLADCPSCRSRLLDFHRARFALLTEPADPQLRTASTPECPSVDDLRQLAADLSPDAIATKLTQHAATCDHCGPLLRSFTEDFSDDFTPEEQAALTNLQSSSAAWQKNTARQMLEAGSASAAGVSTSKSSKTPSAGRPASSDLGRRPLFWKWALVPATAAVVAVAAFNIWYTQRDTPEKVEKLLAQAYTEQRTTELRWPGAEWGPVRVTRGAEESHLSRPSTLLRAEKVIAERQVDGSSGTDWLTVKAEVELLDREPQAAIDNLTQTLNSDPSSSRIKLLLAIAYAYQGNCKESTKNREKALQFLSEVLETEPTDPTALFNRALLYGQLNLPDRAIADWNTLLSVEKNRRWFQEAHDKLGELQLRRNGSGPM